ncbi:hypothetical protein [Microbacterium sp. NPDC076895]|uniref:hypothetical protein n=1 Tax=Microbacterium sp. NPDC076895 TaxID=3154957 RepID=UPI00343DD488
MLYTATLTAAIAIALVLIAGGTAPVAGVAWLLGGPVTIGLTATFQRVDTKRRTQLGYSMGRVLLARILYVGALTLGMIAVIVAAINLALWAGRGF